MTEYINGKSPPFYSGPFTYIPGGAADTDDIETSPTLTITATSKPAWADCQYKGSTHPALLLFGPAAPSGAAAAIFTITRLGIRLITTVDSFGGAGAAMSYVIYRNQVEVGTGLVGAAGAVGASQLDVHDWTTGTLGGATEWRIGYWVDADTGVLSLVNLQVGVGTTTGTAQGKTFLSINHTGMAQIGGYMSRTGTGTFEGNLVSAASPEYYANNMLYFGSAASMNIGATTAQLPLFLCPGVAYLRAVGQTVATDLIALHSIGVVLRSE